MIHHSHDEDTLSEDRLTGDRWLWLKVLAGGIILFLLLEQTLRLTGNINYIPALLVVGTFTTPVSAMVLLYTRDKTPRITFNDLITCLLWGGILGVILAGILEYKTLMRLGVLPMFVVGLIEEAAKLLVPAWLIFRKRHLTELDSIVIGAASGAGFAAFESMGYGFVGLLLSGGDLTSTTTIILIRGLAMPAAHITWSALAAGALWGSVHRTQPHAARRFWLTFLGVVLLHALWDSAPLLSWLPYILLSLIGVGWLLERIRSSSRLWQKADGHKDAIPAA